MNIRRKYNRLSPGNKIALWTAVAAFAGALIPIVLALLPEPSKPPVPLPRTAAWEEKHQHEHLVQFFVIDRESAHPIARARITGIRADSGIDIGTLPNGFSDMITVREGDAFVVQADGFERKEVVLNRSDIDNRQKKVELGQIR